MWAKSMRWAEERTGGGLRDVGNPPDGVRQRHRRQLCTSVGAI